MLVAADYFGQRDKRDFTGQFEKFRDGKIRDRDYLKKIRDTTNGTGPFKKISGRDNKKVCTAGL
jgi:hypothetical protein